ncbi:MAG TPA: APC family permease [Candidatus Dormibacteraeota bacterium]|nr:APC family permease [Candidatus Dormibacteraeota bacterium]
MTTDPAPAPAVTLSESEIASLQDAGKSWAAVPPARFSHDQPQINADLDPADIRGSRLGDRYLRSGRARRQGLEKVAPGILQATARGTEPKTGAGRLARRVRRTVLGQPLATRQLAHERLTKIKALAVLSSDALSSVAYATDQIMIVLLAAGTAFYSRTLPIMGAIIVLLALVVLSYRQTIHAYPKGGGSYIVAKDNLGPLAGLVAGSALMTDYVLTVAVSIASGVSAITSAAPGVQRYTTPLCVGFIVLIVLGNLRGIRESGSIFAAPTYIFIGAMFLMIGTVLVKLATGALHQGSPHIDPANFDKETSIGLFVVLKAFSSGCTALTGVEAISDGVPAFKVPEWRNARRTLTIMGCILALMFIGITATAYILGLAPPDSNDSNILINQLASLAFGSNPLYFIAVASTTAILVLAANTSFSDFPRLFFFLARDEYAPHAFKRMGDRLAFSNGILVLGTLSALLVIAFKGDVTRLIPLYAIGVFLAFTMSQAGMVARHLRLREQGWRMGMAFNFAGMCATAIVLVITASVKFTSGAFIVVILIPLLVLVFRGIHNHYRDVHGLTATETPISPESLHPICIVPISDLNGPALQSLALARTISANVIAVHVNDNEEEIARLQAKWAAWGNHVPLEIIESPYRSLLRPLLNYIDAIDKQGDDHTLVVVLPEFVATRWWQQVLHNQSALRLKAALLFRPGTVVVNVPYHMRHTAVPRRRRARRDGADDL